jgi:hypothetical protein
MELPFGVQDAVVLFAPWWARWSRFPELVAQRSIGSFDFAFLDLVEDRVFSEAFEVRDEEPRAAGDPGRARPAATSGRMEADLSLRFRSSEAHDLGSSSDRDQAAVNVRVDCVVAG